MDRMVVVVPRAFKTPRPKVVYMVSKRSLFPLCLARKTAALESGRIGPILKMEERYLSLLAIRTAALESGRIGPILKMEERYLSLLAIRYVNNVISNAPLVITNELLDFFAVDFVAVGLHTDDNWEAEHDPFKIPRARGIFRHVDSGSDVTTRQVIKRIISNSAYADRNRLKEAREAEAIARSTANNSVENF
nr:hypothetical transcript [Hymenolepis microstoma]